MMTLQVSFNLAKERVIGMCNRESPASSAARFRILLKHKGEGDQSAPRAYDTESLQGLSSEILPANAQN